MKAIQIVVPVLGMTFPHNVACLLREQELLWKRGFKVEIVHHVNESLISRARCIIAHKFLASDFEYLMCIDSDIIFPPGSIEKLVAHNKLVVGANYRHKTEAEERWAGIPENFQEALSECRRLPTGFMLIHRESFQQLIELKTKNPLFNLDFFHTNEFKNIWGFYVPYINQEHHYLSEDWAFTDRLSAAGIKSYLDNRINLGHLGYKVY